MPEEAEPDVYVRILHVAADDNAVAAYHDQGSRSPLFDWGGYNALNLGFRRRVQRDILVQVDFKQGETDMADKGKKDKGKREHQKTAQSTPEEKRKLKKDKKNDKKNG